MSVSTAKEIYMHSKDRGFTEEEYDALSDEMMEAREKGDMEEYERLGKMLPTNPDVAMIFKEVYGKEHLLALGLDLTEANLRFGEGWLDEPNKR